MAEPGRCVPKYKGKNRDQTIGVLVDQSLWEDFTFQPVQTRVSGKSHQGVPEIVSQFPEGIPSFSEGGDRSHLE